MHPELESDEQVAVAVGTYRPTIGSYNVGYMRFQTILELYQGHELQVLVEPVDLVGRWE